MRIINAAGTEMELPQAWENISNPTLADMAQFGFVEAPPQAPHVPTNDEIITGLTSALESYYDTKAHERKYDNRLTCALRAGYTGPFQKEGQSFAIWMDNCNVYAYGVMTACLAGTRAIPTAAELIAELPALVWA